MDEMIEAVKSSLVDDYAISVGKNPDKIFEKCVELCDRYSIDAEEIASSWIAFAASKGFTEMEVNLLDDFEKMELSCRKDEPAKSARTIPEITPTATACKIDVFGQSSNVNAYSDEEVENDEILEVYGVKPTFAATPKAEKKPVSRFRTEINNKNNTPTTDYSPAGYSPAVSTKSVAYGSRTKAGDAVLRYKCKDSDYWNEDSGNHNLPAQVIPVSCTKSLISQQKDFKYMFQKSTEMAATLNSVIVDLGFDMLDKDEKDVQDLRISSVEECWYLGRIRNEDGRLSQGSTFFEGDLDLSGGHIVALDLSGVEEYRLFPGQVVLLKGKNELGKCLRVSAVEVPAPLPPPEVDPAKTRPLNFIVASGPYTPIDSMVYEPLMDLLKTIKTDKPDVCILSGPFVDYAHPLVAGGEIADTFEKIFDDLLNQIEKAIQNLKTQVVIIATCKDAFHDAVFPTPPYGVSRKNITVLPDPAIFEIAGITIGFTTMDILKHLANTEISKSTVMDRMGGLSKLILSQRSFYPLYPPDESTPLDIQLWKNYCKFSQTPHILILPSDLRYFIKEVEGTIVMNPERLTKGKSGGTYARFQVKLPETTNDIVHSVADFCSGEIIKI